MTLIHGFAIEERPLTASDEREGIDARWKVSAPEKLFYVIHVAKGRGRWSGPGSYLCSHCPETADPQPDTGTRFCVIVDAVRETNPAPPAPAA